MARALRPLLRPATIKHINAKGEDIREQQDRELSTLSGNLKKDKGSIAKIDEEVNDIILMASSIVKDVLSMTIYQQLKSTTSENEEIQEISVRMGRGAGRTES